MRDKMWSLSFITAHIHVYKNRTFVILNFYDFLLAFQMTKSFQNKVRSCICPGIYKNSFHPSALRKEANLKMMESVRLKVYKM